jgi:hypothetical protein
MFKILAIFALATFIVPMQTYAQPHKVQQVSSSQKPAVPVPPPVPIQQTSSPTLQTEQKQHVDADVRVVSTPAKDGYDKAAFWISCVLAFVGLCGIGIGICTLRSINVQAKEMQRQNKTLVRQSAILERQTKAAEDSAKTALLNAQAVINAERPWIIVSVEPVSWPRGGFNIFAKNEGRTPAMITTARMGCIAVKELGDLPEEAPFGAGSMMQDRIVLPGDKPMINWFDSVTLRKILGKDIPELVTKEHVFIFGKVLYRNLLDPSPNSGHETRWICLYQHPFGEESDSVFRMEGLGVPEEYDHYT